MKSVNETLQGMIDRMEEMIRDVAEEDNPQKVCTAPSAEYNGEVLGMGA